MAIEIVFETHSVTVDNEQGRATGWPPGELSGRGRALAAELGRRRGADEITAVSSSDLARAAQTAAIAFGASGIPVLHDWRLRECDYGQRVLVIGHVAARWGLDHYINGTALEDLAHEDFAWREGWEYRPP